MTEDLRPAPRLPLDTADYVATSVSGNGVALDGFVNFEPGEEVYQISLLETRTPLYWAAAHDRQFFDIDMAVIWPDAASALAVIEPVLTEFTKVTPRPPQWPWEF